MGKLMVPLFYNEKFNDQKYKIRAELFAEVSDDVHTYSIWHRSGKPEITYPRAENDLYLLYVEINGYLAPLRMTEFQLVDQCGFPAACKELYGSIDGRNEFFHNLRMQANATHDESIIVDEINKEQKRIKELGSRHDLWLECIKQYLDDHVDFYKKSLTGERDSFPDFIGALVMDDLDTCVALRNKFCEKQHALMEKKKEEDKAYCKEQNQLAEKQVQDAIATLKDGGVIENDLIEIYKARHDIRKEYLIILLARMLKVDIPPRTSGWIKENLASMTVENGRCARIRYCAANRCPQRIFPVLDALVQAAKKEN